jgi:hypothetical protein
VFIINVCDVRTQRRSHENLIIVTGHLTVSQHVAVQDNNDVSKEDTAFSSGLSKHLRRLEEKNLLGCKISDIQWLHVGHVPYN